MFFLQAICPFAFTHSSSRYGSLGLVALTEKLLFPDERGVGEGQHGVDADVGDWSGECL